MSQLMNMFHTRFSFKTGLRFLTCMALLICCGTLAIFAGDVQLTWTANAESDLSGYKVYYGTISRSYPNSITVGKVASYTVTGLAGGTYYFALTAYDTSGNESGFSNEVSKTVAASASGTSTSTTCTSCTLLVDFGKAGTTNLFGLSGWNTAFQDTYTDNRDIGPGGTTIVTGSNATYNYQGVSGTSRTFAAGDTIIVTWYNNSGSSINFTPKISFNDPNRPAVDPPGVWYDMSPVTLAPNSIGTSQYVLTSTSAGTYSLVNTNVNYQNSLVVICDKIELLPAASSGGSSALAAPSNIKVK